MNALFALTILAWATTPPQPASAVRSRLDAAAVFLRMGQPAEALGALEQARRDEPDNPWIDFYQGQAEQQLGHPYRAIDAYDRAVKTLDDLNHPDPQLERTIHARRRIARRQIFSFTQQIGLAYDTNVTFLGGGASDLNLIANAPDGLFSNDTTVTWSPVADGDSLLTFGLRTGQSWHADIDSFDFQDYGGSIHYIRRLGQRWRVEAGYDYDITYLGNEPYLSNHALTSAVQYVWPTTSGPVRPTTSALGYRLEGRDFLFATTPAFDQDGVVNAAAFRQMFSVQPIPRFDWTWDVGLGYEFASIATEGTEFDRLTNSFGVDLDVPLVNPADATQYLILPDRELRFHFGANWLLADFRKPSEIDRRNRHRRDLITTLSFAVSQKLITDPKLGDVTLSGLIQWTIADSNVVTDRHAVPFSYDKIVYGLNLQWSF